jgi:hypothetical protein
MWLLNGKKRTRYAAAWTLVNAHEVRSRPLTL